MLLLSYFIHLEQYQLQLASELNQSNLLSSPAQPQKHQIPIASYG